MRPLEVYEVLEQEYAATYGPIDVPSLEVTVEQLLDPAAARSLLLPFIGPVGETAEQIVSAINRVRLGEVGALRERVDRASLSPATRKAIAEYDELNPEERELVDRRIIDEVFAGAIRAYGDVRLSNFFTAVHAQAKKGRQRSALCLSAGGVRSTAFGLGVLTGLARRRLLTKLDYLSTVAGGSFIGSWFSAWVRRHPRGVAGVEEELAARERQDVTLDRRAAAEAVPVAQLRRWINYLRPQFSLLSADSWTAVGVYLRNVVLKLLVIVPLVMAAIAFPRVVAYSLEMSRQYTGTSLLVMAAIAAGVAYAWRDFGTHSTGVLRSTWFGAMRPDAAVVVFFLLPMVAAAFLVSLVWYGSSEDPRTWRLNAVVALAIVGGAELLRGMRQGMRLRRGDLTRWLRENLVGSGATIFATIITGVLLAITARAFPNPGHIARDTWIAPDRWALLTAWDRYAYLCFAVPLLLLVAFLHINALTSIRSSVRPESDRQWWLRTSSWLLIGGSTWAVVSWLAIYGPIVLMYQTIPAGSAGVAATVIATILGVRTASEEDSKERKTETPLARAFQLVFKFSTPVFLVFAIAMLSYATTSLELASGTPAPEVDARGLASEPLLANKADRIPAIVHLEVVARTSPASLLLYGTLAVIGLVVSLTLGINQFSSAALHRNRLMRGVLAAARTRRRADRVSGFDPDDDFALHLLRPEYFHPESFHDAERFVDEVGRYASAILEEVLRAETLALLRQRPSTAVAMEAVCADLNEYLEKNLPSDGAEGDRITANRRLLEKELGKWLRPVSDSAAPTLVMNAAATFFAEDAPYSEEAASASFTMSPLHCGSLRIGYRPSRSYTNEHGGISLATAAAVSSAPAGVGQEFSSSPASFLRTLLNVLEPQRGWWLGNPGWAGTQTHARANPRHLVAPLLSETLHHIDESSEWLPLSAGGRFDAVGLYEMVLRRCHTIIVVDATRDPDYMFAALGSAILRIRADLGVPISLAKPRMGARGKQSKGLYCATGTIRYSLADGPDAEDGSLIYIKPGFYDDPSLPADVYSYGSMVRDFPHETIRSGTMTEQQFEAYRTFGEYCVSAIVGSTRAADGDIGRFVGLAKSYANPPSRKKPRPRYHVAS